MIDKYSAKLFGFFKDKNFVKCLRCPYTTKSYWNMVDHDSEHNKRQLEIQKIREERTNEYTERNR